MEFKDQVVLVTGAGRGIGKAIALAFAREGASVAINDIRAQEELDALALEMAGADRQCVAIRADVSRTDQVGTGVVVGL